MSNEKSLMFLVGDNPFHGISHLSQERSRMRGTQIDETDYAAGLVSTSLENGAEGFMFSVSSTTLSILEALRKNVKNKRVRLYAIVPYAYEYVRLATQAGGLTGIAGKIAKQILFSANFRAILMGSRAFITMDPVSLLKTYLYYEIGKIRSSAGKQVKLESVILHEVITDMALALDMKWLFESYANFLTSLKIEPGFETRNFPYLVERFEQWGFDFRGKVIVTAFNKAGFQMNPSKSACEKALTKAYGGDIIAMSILAAGYLKPFEAIDYIQSLSGLKGVVVGVSKERHARETFSLLKERLAHA